jgi:hypothetical protein
MLSGINDLMTEPLEQLERSDSDLRRKGVDEQLLGVNIERERTRDHSTLV